MTRTWFERLFRGSLIVGGCGVAFALQARADAPAGRYTISGGTVLDTKTQLTWQQVVDTAKKYEWDKAGQYCAALSLNGTGWRLPSINELQTLVDETRTSPAIDPTFFPSTPASTFWTSSSAPMPTYAWTVSFVDGKAAYFGTAQECVVRCVR